MNNNDIRTQIHTNVKANFLNSCLFLNCRYICKCIQRNKRKIERNIPRYSLRNKKLDRNGAFTELVELIKNKLYRCKCLQSETEVGKYT